jgi:transcriptional regulator with XRE-family HTH domain
MITTKDKIYQLRHKWGMSQAEFADKMHISGSMVSGWERGKAIPSKDMLYRIAKAFDVSVAWLLEEDEEAEESIQNNRAAEKNINPTGALFFLIVQNMKLEKIEELDGETQVIATVKGDVAEMMEGIMHMQTAVDKGIMDAEMFTQWKESKMQEYGVEVVK